MGGDSGVNLREMGGDFNVLVKQAANVLDSSLLGTSARRDDADCVYLGVSRSSASWCDVSPLLSLVAKTRMCVLSLFSLQYFTAARSLLYMTAVSPYLTAVSPYLTVVSSYLTMISPYLTTGLHLPWSLYS